MLVVLQLWLLLPLLLALHHSFAVFSLLIQYFFPPCLLLFFLPFFCVFRFHCKFNNHIFKSTIYNFSVQNFHPQQFDKIKNIKKDLQFPYDQLQSLFNRLFGIAQIILHQGWSNQFINVRAAITRINNI